MIVGRQSLTLKCFARVFSLEKTPYNLMGNESIYSVCKEIIKALFIFAKQRVLRVPREMALLTKNS